MEIVPVWDNLPASLTWKEKVCFLTYQSLQFLEQGEGPIEHLFVPGYYIREQRLPPQALITGNEHLVGHEIELLEGSAILFAPDGKKRFDAYAKIHTKPGFHAVAWTLTAVLVRTLHPNPEESRDIRALEKQWFGESEKIIEQGRVLSQLLGIELCPPRLA
jgi:hypothetical protein